MKQILMFFTLLTISIVGNAQGNWTWTKIASLPFATANNAVTEVVLEEEKFVYSFGGISDSLHSQNIHQRVFKYKVSQDEWTEVDPIPDTLGKIGSAASFVNNKIYLIGGYHIENNGTETSSNKVHVYDPINDVFESDGTPLPIPVDNHVQSVWKDSLIFVVSGKNNSASIPDVQIYNPYTNSWSFGTTLPDTPEFKSFGASGYITGDTLFYLGGVSKDPTLKSNGLLRKGIIDSINPTQIEWSIVDQNSGEPLYRAACSGHNKTVFWIGGTKEGYDYNAMTYYTAEPVKPNKRTIELDIKSKNINNIYSFQTQAMDLSGIAKVGGGNWIIAGGIDSLQQATSNTFLLHNPKLSDIEKANNPPFFKVKGNGDYFEVMTENVGDITIYDIQGRTLFKTKKKLADLKIHKTKLQKGILLFVYFDHINLPVNIKIINP